MASLNVNFRRNLGGAMPKTSVLPTRALALSAVSIDANPCQLRQNNDNGRLTVCGVLNSLAHGWKMTEWLAQMVEGLTEDAFCW